MRYTSPSAVKADYAGVVAFLEALGVATVPVTLAFGEVDARCVSPRQIKQAVEDAASEGFALNLHLTTPGGPVHFLTQTIQTPDESSALTALARQPTAALFKNGTTLALFALDTPVRKDDPTVVKIAAALSPTAKRRRVPPLTNVIPTPGADGWRLIHLDPSRRFSLADLVARPDRTLVH